MKNLASWMRSTRETIAIAVAAAAEGTLIELVIVSRNVMGMYANEWMTMKEQEMSTHMKTTLLSKASR